MGGLDDVTKDATVTNRLKHVVVEINQEYEIIVPIITARTLNMQSKVQILLYPPEILSSILSIHATSVHIR